MIDITIILRAPWDDGFTIHQPRDIELKAADEIDRLRSELAKAMIGDNDTAKKESS